MGSMFSRLFKRHYLFLIFTALYFIIAFTTYKSYSITADEQYRYERGREFLQIIKHKPTLTKHTQIYVDPDAYYIYPMLLNIFNPSFSYETFHLENMIFAFGTFIAFYALVYLATRNKKSSIAAVLMLYLSPTFSGHLAFNPIDISFTTFYMISLLLIYLWGEQRKMYLLVLLGITIALTQSIRLIGLSLYVVLGMYELYTYIIKVDRQNWKLWLKENSPKYFVMLAVSTALVASIWQLQGVNYFQQFSYQLSVNSNFNQWDNIIWYMGRYIYKDQRPWHYLFVYLTITTPIYILVGFLMSILSIKELVKNKIFFLIISSVLLNLVLYACIQPVIYNTLRHFSYLIPQITMAAFLFFFEFFRTKGYKITKKLLLALILINVSFVIMDIGRLFPHQYSYFNELVGGVSHQYKNFETEYWGTSYKDAAEWIKNDYVKNTNIRPKVFSCALGYAMEYYADNKYEYTYSIGNADIVVCDNMEYTRRGYNYKVLHVIQKDAAVLNLIMSKN